MARHSSIRCAPPALIGFLVLLVSACGGGQGGTSPNHPPTANAGAAQTVFKSSPVTLDGSGSSDPDGNPLTYTWSQMSGAAVQLKDASSAMPTFTAPGVSGTLTFSLVVNDGHVDSAAATVTVTVQNRAPTAMAGSSSSITPGQIYTLDGSGSSDPDHDPLTFKWTQVSGTSVTLNDATESKATFTAPSQPGILVFSLVVNDGEVDSQPSQVSLGVGLPIASTGPDQTVPKRSQVMLAGSGSPSSSALTFLWQQVSGTPVTLTGANTANPSFSAPAVEGDLEFSLTVNDGASNSLPSDVTVHVVNLAPAISSVTLSPASPRRADAITANVAAVDPDGDAVTLSYVWTRSGTVVANATTSAYPLGNQAKGDTIAVTVTASDGETSVSASASVVIADTAAVLASNAPSSATYGVPLSFQVTGSDVDGDPIGSFELAYGPAGMTVSSTGVVTWTPSGPLFDRATDMNWQVRLHDAPAVSLTGTITVNDANRKYPLFRSNASLATRAGLEVADFSGDGKEEILVGSSQAVYLLQKSGADYVQIWSYPFDAGHNSGIQAVASGDVDGDGHREIFFSSGPILLELDGVTRREIARYGTYSNIGGNVSGPVCQSLKVADVDNDGALELVCLGIDAGYLYPATGRIYVFDARTLTLKWQSDDLVLGTSMAVGNVDADPALEIVTSGGYVFDGATGAVKWAYGPGFGAYVDVGDVIGDGVGKIVAADGTGTSLSPGEIRVFDAVAKTTLFSIPATGLGFSAVKVAELDGTAPAEILASDDQWGNVYVYRYSSGAPRLLTQINSIGDGITAIAAGDVDGDGQQELVWSPTFSLTNGSPTLAIASWSPTAALKWTGPLPVQIDGPFTCAKLAQITPTQKSLIYATPTTGQSYTGMRVVAMDPLSGALTFSDEVDSNWSRNSACDVADVTGGPTDSVLLSTATLYTNYLTAYDFATSTKQWVSPTLANSPLAITHADTNGDSFPDLIGITGDGHVYSWDVHNQALVWSQSVQGYGVNVVSADLYGDGKQEIVALTTQNVFVFSQGSGGLTQVASASVNGGMDLLVADTDGDGKAEVYVLAPSPVDGSALLYRFDDSLNLLNASVVGPYATSPASLYLEESSFARKNILVSISPGFLQSTATTIVAVDPKTGSQIWESPPLHGNLQINSLNFYDLRGDGQEEIAFGTTAGMYVTQ